MSPPSPWGASFLKSCFLRPNLSHRGQEVPETKVIRIRVEREAGWGWIGCGASLMPSFPLVIAPLSPAAAACPGSSKGQLARGYRTPPEAPLPQLGWPAPSPVTLPAHFPIRRER